MGILCGVALPTPTDPGHTVFAVADLPVILRIIQFALRRRHRWRGRAYRRGKGGIFEPVGSINSPRRHPVNRIADFAIYQAMHVIARILTGNRLTTVAQGLENLPATGPAIIAARHYHHLFDGLAFFAAVERRFHFVVTLDWAQSRRSKFLMSMLNRLARWPMVLREDALLSGTTQRRTLFKPSDLPRYQLAALRQSVKLLGEKRLLIIFPEGYPNIDPIYTPRAAPMSFYRLSPGSPSSPKARNE